MAETCVFVKQSVEPLRCDPAQRGVSLLPKLRDLFAEFLNEGSPVRLRILYSSTGVGLGYGQPASSPACLFSSPGSVHFLPEGTASRALPACHRLPPGGWTSPGPRRRAPPTGTGLLTGCPSPAPSGLGLGPTNPTRTDLASEPLDSRRTWFSQIARYSCQHSHSDALQQAFQLAFSARRTLPYHEDHLAVVPIPGFGGRFSPVVFSAPSRWTSELLRTLSRMAASKPTSWLSVHGHFVSHSAGTPGP